MWYEYLAPLLMIIWVNILLSGDNALVIAMACQNLPEKQKKIGTICGAVGAILARFAMLFVAASMLIYPGVKLAGGLFLFYIAFKMIQESDNPGHHSTNDTLFAAISTIIIADVMMSLDNVVAIVAAAHGDKYLIFFGMIISVPMIVIGATLLSKLLEKYPVMIKLGAALLCYIAVETMLEDPLYEQGKEWTMEKIYGRT